MKPRICLENANFAYQFTDNHQKYGNIGDVAIKIEAVLY